MNLQINENWSGQLGEHKFSRVDHYLQKRWGVNPPINVELTEEEFEELRIGQIYYELYAPSDYPPSEEFPVIPYLHIPHAQAWYPDMGSFARGWQRCGPKGEDYEFGANIPQPELLHPVIAYYDILDCDGQVWHRDDRATLVIVPTTVRIWHGKWDYYITVEKPNTVLFPIPELRCEAGMCRRTVTRLETVKEEEEVKLIGRVGVGRYKPEVYR